MKKLLFILFILPVWCFAQSPVTPQFNRKIPSDSLLGAKTPQGTLHLPDTSWVKKYSGKDLVAKATDFEGAGTVASKFGLRDTVLKDNWIFRSASTTNPALSLVSGNTAGSYVFSIKDLSGNTRAGISLTTMFANEYHYYKGQSYAALNMSDSGSTVFRNLPNGYLMRWASATKEWGRLDSNGFILRTDTGFMTAHGDAVPTVKWVRVHGGGGGTYTGSHGIGLTGSDFRPVTGTMNGNVTWSTDDTSNLTFQSDDGSGNFASSLYFAGTLTNGFNQSGGGSGFTQYSSDGSNGQVKIGFSQSGGGGIDKSLTFGDGSLHKGVWWIDNTDLLGGQFAADYSTNQRLHPNAIASVKTVQLKIDSSLSAFVPGGVTSVSGTANRITSTGGTTPVIDISSTFEALLEKVANKSTTTTLGTSNTLYPSQNAVKTYVDNAIAGVTVPTAGNPSGLLTFTASNGSNTTYERTDGLHAIDSTIVASYANHPTLAQLQTKVNGYVPTTRTVNGKALSANITLGLASSDFANQGTTTTVLHGNAAGNPSFGAVSLTADVTGLLPNANLANSTISGISLGSNLAALTATDATVTFSGSYTGATARTVGLNLGQANTWTAAPTVSLATAASATYGATLTSTTAATSGNQKWSPFIQFQGNGWGTTGGATTVAIGDIGLIPIQNGGGQYGQMVIRATFGSSTPVTMATFDPSGPNFLPAGDVTLPSGAAVFTNAVKTTANNLNITLQAGRTWNTAGDYVLFNPGTASNSSGTVYGIRATQTLNQSGSAAYTGYMMNLTETAVVAGNVKFVDYQVASTSKYSVKDDGTINSASLTASQLVGTDASKNLVSLGTLNSKPHTIFTPTTGGTVSLTNNQYNIINPAGTLVALTVNLPSSPANNDCVFIKYTQSITTVTYGNGTVVDGITAPTAGGLVVLTYDSGTTSWY